MALSALTIFLNFLKPQSVHIRHHYPKGFKQHLHTSQTGVSLTQQQFVGFCGAAETNINRSVRRKGNGVSL